MTKESESAPTTTTTVLSVDTNINVIYDGDSEDNTNCGGRNKNEDEPTRDGGGSTNETRQADATKTPGDKMSEFVNFDRVEAENGGYEQENYASCLVERSQHDSPLISDQAGRLNFWQPINNRGALHLVAHYTYRLAPAKLTRRESFRTPIERAPSDNATALDKLIRSSQLERDQVWLVASCEDDLTATMMAQEDATATLHSKSAALLAELTRQQVDPATAEVDSEVVVRQFNLTGLNEITNKYLLLLKRHDERRATRIACCKVTKTNTMPAFDLVPEHANKTTSQLIEATRN